MASATPAAAKKNDPADFLKTILGRPVVVKLNSGVDYRGRRLLCARSLSCSLAIDRSPSRIPIQACLPAWMGT